jgi:hypothetical protein
MLTRSEAFRNVRDMTLKEIMHKEAESYGFDADAIMRADAFADSMSQGTRAPEQVEHELSFEEEVFFRLFVRTSMRQMLENPAYRQFLRDNSSKRVALN